MSPDKKVELFYDAYRRHPEARVGTVVQRINRLERAEELRKESDLPNPRGLVKFLRKVIWAWLPDNAGIHRHPFGALCDLCSEYWVFDKETAA